MITILRRHVTFKIWAATLNVKVMLSIYVVCNPQLVKLRSSKNALSTFHKSVSNSGPDFAIFTDML